MAYVYLDGWANYTLKVVVWLILNLDDRTDYTIGVVVWLIYTSTAWQIILSCLLYGLCISRRLDRLYPQGSCLAYVFLEGWADYTIGVVVSLIYTSTVEEIILSG